ALPALHARLIRQQSVFDVNLFWQGARPRLATLPFFTHARLRLFRPQPSFFPGEANGRVQTIVRTRLKLAGKNRGFLGAKLATYFSRLKVACKISQSFLPATLARA